MNTGISRAVLVGVVLGSGAAFAQTAPAGQAADPEQPPARRGASTAVIPPAPPPSAEPERARPALLAGMFLPLRPARFLMSLGTGSASLDKASASAHQMGDSGATLNGTLGLIISDVFMVSTSFSFAFPDDHGSFSQVVVPELGGDPRTAESSLSVIGYSIAASLRTPFLALGATDHGWVGTALFAGYGTAGIQGSRSITDCKDCHTEDFDLPGGTFWQAGVDLYVPSSRPKASYGVTIVYQRYAAGTGFTDEFRVAFSCWLQ